MRSLLWPRVRIGSESSAAWIPVGCRNSRASTPTVELAHGRPLTVALRSDHRAREPTSLHYHVRGWVRQRRGGQVGTNIRSIGSGRFVGAVRGEGVIAARVVGEANCGYICREEVPGRISA